MKRQSFIKGAAIIAAGGFLAKLIGALYRIPLTNLIGGYGMGLYQMVYPFYCLLLTVSATGIPSSIAKMTARKRALGESTKPVLKSALLLFVMIGAAGTVLMAALSPLLTAAQDCRELKWGYIALAPSVLLVSAISVFRGWFQGENNMFPTALSEVTEQVVKVAFGLLFAYLYRDDAVKAVSFILLAVSLSEGVALALMVLLFKRVPAPFMGRKEGDRVSLKSVLRLSIPVTLAAALLPLSSLLDSVVLVRLMKAYSDQAVALYGLFSGGAITIINLPVSVCYGIAAASVPAVSVASAVSESEGQNASENGAIRRTPSGTARGTGREEKVKTAPSARRRVLYALGVTAAVSIPSALGLFFFAAPAVKIIFRSLSKDESAVLINLVRILSVSAATLSCTQTLSACLTGLGKPQKAAFAMLLAVIAKTVLEFALVSNPEISVYGAAIAADVCYLVAFSFDLVYNLSVTKRKKTKSRSGAGGENVAEKSPQNNTPANLQDNAQDDAQTHTQGEKNANDYDRESGSGARGFDEEGRGGDPLGGQSVGGDGENRLL